LVLVTFGLLFCLTVLGLPIGLTLVAAGFKGCSDTAEGYSAGRRVRVRRNERWN
jgi:hypothetical protein